MKQAALEWLHKQLKSKDMALFRALHKVNASEEEIANLEDAIEIIEYLIRITESAEPKTK
jgi:hypothetical protein